MKALVKVAAQLRVLTDTNEASDAPRASSTAPASDRPGPNKGVGTFSQKRGLTVPKKKEDAA
jgi:hypothetical protein